jgi:UDP-3-O-[3-hydroxymyristoyl] glucosamine N-acyltransferase
MGWDIQSILSDIGIEYSFLGPQKMITGVSSLKEATQDDLSFCWYEGENAASLISESKAGVILCKKSI